MSKIKVGIVEDEVIIADDIQLLLEQLEYDVLQPCENYEEAVAMLQNEQPDLVILDVNLGEQKDGIDIAKYIRSNMNIPFIFLTANSDIATVTRAKVTNPNAYLVKPFNKSDLFTAIEVALFNFNTIKPPTQEKEKKILKKAVFIKDGEYFIKVPFDEILYLSSEHVYVVVHTKQRKYLVRTTMQEYIDSFDADLFFRIHRSYVANLEKIEKINSTSILVGGEELPISKNYRESLLNLLNIK